MSSDPQSQILGVRSACELLGMLKSREISSVELLEHFVERNDALVPLGNTQSASRQRKHTHVLSAPPAATTFACQEAQREHPGCEV